MIKFRFVLVPFFIFSNSLANDSYLVDSKIDIERTGKDLEDSKKKAVYDGKSLAIENILKLIEKDYVSEKKFSTNFIEECIDSYTIKSEKFIGITYQATILYKINVDQLKRFLKQSDAENIKNKIDIIHNIKSDYDLSSGKEVMVIPVNRNLRKQFDFLYKLIGQDYLLNLYSVTADSIKLYASNRLKDLLSENKVYFYMDFSK